MPLNHPTQGYTPQQVFQNNLPNFTTPPQTFQTGGQNNAHNSSFASSYHPATTPFPNRQPENVNLSGSLANFQQNRQPIHMNSCQAQQYMGKMLANRKYDGYQADQKTFVALEEFMGLIRQYKFSTNYDDLTILSQNFHIYAWGSLYMVANKWRQSTVH